MEYWYFQFEGVFRERSPKHGLKGVCSSVMLPSLRGSEAKEELVNALDAEEIDLVSVDDKFLYDPGDIDESDEDNRVWINWYDEAVKANKAVFTPWQVFDV